MCFLIVIPARGGSKGIPGKNIRLMNGRPLIEYAINNAKSLKKSINVDIVVDTDDEEIAEVVGDYGIQVIMRPDELARDDITLDPVIYHAVIEAERNNGKKYDVVITLQVTSPTLKSITLKRAIDYFSKNKKDSLISVVNKPHLSWKDSKDGKEPEYSVRVNRQFLPAHYEETGAFLITRREFVSEKSRLGKNIDVYEIPEEQSVDIDTPVDWNVCEKILKRKKIILRADGEENLGMGHVYRCLSIALHLTGHEILFVTNKNFQLGVDKIKNSNFPFQLIETENDFFQVINDWHPDIVVNDILNTRPTYMKRMKLMVPRVINFEDKGRGADYADCVINALYQNEIGANRFNGFPYYFIRDEFLTAKPKEFSEQVNNVVVLFGGSDPSNLTKKTYTALKKISVEFPDVEYHIITGFGYAHKDEIVDSPKHRIFVHNDVKRVSKYMKNADMAITSQGRTIYELACMGIPSIVLAQNIRETEHNFANVRNGYINLGIGKRQSVDTIKSTVEWLMKTPNVRKEMHDILLEKDFTKGQQRVIDLILGESS